MTTRSDNSRKHDAGDRQTNEGQGDPAPPPLSPAVIPADVEELIDELASDPDLVHDPIRLRAVITQHILTHWSGPMPPPAVIEEFDRIVPGTAQQIFDDFFEEGRHRRAMESKVVKLRDDTIRSDSQRQDRGLVLGFVVAVLFLAGSILLALADHEPVAITLGGGTLVAIVIAFITVGRGDDRSSPPGPPVEHEE